MDTESAKYQALLFIHHSAKKLKLQNETACTAKALFHKFYAVQSIEDFDCHLVAMSALYLAGKLKDESCRIRDVITTCYRHLHPEVPFLKIGKDYWHLRDSLVQCEMIILRSLNFDMDITLPFSYFFNFCMSIVSVVPHSEEWISLVSQLGWMLLNDCFYGSMSIKYTAFELAGGCMFLALDLLELSEKCAIEPRSDSSEPFWSKVFGLDMKKNKEIAWEALLIYNKLQKNNTGHNT